MLAAGPRPAGWKMSLEPESREATSPITPSPFQYERTESRYLSFHSAQPGGKLPSWYTPSATSQVAATHLPHPATGGKVPVVIGASGHALGFGVKFLLREHRDPPSRREKRPVAIERVRGVAGQRRSEVEAKAVDMHLLDPVAQAVH